MSEDKKEVKEKKIKVADEPGGAAAGREKKAADPIDELRRGLHGLTKKELEDKVVELAGRLKEEETRAKEYLDDAQRNRAELENYRKRMLREQTRIIEQANRSFITALLPVIDNLEMALESCGDRDDGLAQGVRMVYEQMMALLKKEGLEEINPQGHPFDPEECEAVMAVMSDDHEDETVVEVHQKGYRYNGSLLRPARATVSKCS
jgi:molecular chaperone GrpE